MTGHIVPEYQEDDPQETIKSLRIQLTIAREQLSEAKRPEPSGLIWNDGNKVDPENGVLVAMIIDNYALTKGFRMGNKWYRQSDEDSDELVVVRSEVSYWAALPDGVE